MMKSTPPLNPNHYLWHQSSDDTSIWQRSTLAGECMWAQRPQELREIFLCSSLTLKTPIFRRTFNASLKHAWKLLRYSIPDLGLRTSTSGTNGKSLLQYHTITDEEAQNWVNRTHCCQSGSHKQDFEDLRKSLLAAKQGGFPDNAFMYSRAIVEDGAELLKHSQIMICIDHQISDGIGTRIILGKFCELLASTLAAPETIETEIRWEDSRHNLAQPWIRCMNEAQLFSGPEYEATAAANRDVILNRMKYNPGLPLLQTPGPVNQETYFLNLTTTQTTGLLKAVKHAVSPDSNITHLGHAGMVLALLRKIPESVTSSSILYSSCWLNGRRYLHSSANDPQPTKSYVPICQSFAPIVFNDLEQLVLDPSSKKEEVRDVLVRACRAATAGYEKIKEKKSMLPECVVLFEDLGSGMASKKQKTSINQKTEHVSEASVQTADPFFLSDGITEQYISHSYPSPSLSSASSNTAQQSLFTVDDVQFAAHAEKNLIVRMSSWRNQTTISGEWRSCDFDRETVVSFLEDVVGIMTSIVE